MKKSILASLAVVAMAASTSAMAHSHDVSPSYDHVELGLQKIEGTGDEQFRLDLSKTVYDSVFVRASWVEGLTSDTDEIRLGAGYAHTLPHGLDLYVGASYVHQDLPVSSESGYDVFAGVRYMALPQLELNAEVVHTDVFDDYQLYSIGARYHVGDFSVSASYGMFSESGTGDLARIGVAWHF